MSEEFIPIENHPRFCIPCNKETEFTQNTQNGFLCTVCGERNSEGHWEHSTWSDDNKDGPVWGP